MVYRKASTGHCRSARRTAFWRLSLVEECVLHDVGLLCPGGLGGPFLRELEVAKVVRLPDRPFRRHGAGRDGGPELVAGGGASGVSGRRHGDLFAGGQDAAGHVSVRLVEPGRASSTTCRCGARAAVQGCGAAGRRASRGWRPACCVRSARRRSSVPPPAQRESRGVGNPPSRHPWRSRFCLVGSAIQSRGLSIRWA